MRRFAGLFLALAASVIAAVAAAQTIEARPLTGLRGFDIVVEDLDEDAMRCGLTGSALEERLRQVLDASKMQIHAVNSHSDTYVYLVVTVLESCSSVTELSVETGVIISRSKREATASVWKQGVVRSGGDAVGDTLEGVEGLADWLVRDWNSVNDSI
jgi:hypothetical protein